MTRSLSITMKWTSAIALLALLTIATATKAFAQQQAIQGKIPFNFTVGEKTLPAGEYVVYAPSDNVMKFQSRDRRNSVLVMGSQSHHDTAGGIGLEFDRIGDEYFLRRVFRSHSRSSLNLDVEMGKPEKTAREREAKLLPNAQVLVAMK
jgi:hypothetical protein